MTTLDFSKAGWADLLAELSTVDPDIYAVSSRATQLLREQRGGTVRREVLRRLAGRGVSAGGLLEAR